MACSALKSETKEGFLKEAALFWRRAFCLYYLHELVEAHQQAVGFIYAMAAMRTTRSRMSRC